MLIPRHVVLVKQPLIAAVLHRGKERQVGWGGPSARWNASIASDTCTLHSCLQAAQLLQGLDVLTLEAVEHINFKVFLEAPHDAYSACSGLKIMAS